MRADEHDLVPGRIISLIHALDRGHPPSRITDCSQVASCPQAHRSFDPGAERCSREVLPSYTGMRLRRSSRYWIASIAACWSEALSSHAITC